MPQSVEDLLVRIDASTEQLRREMRRADQNVTRHTRSMDRALSRVDAGFRRMGNAARRVNGALAAIGIAVGASGMTRLATRSLKSAEQVERLSLALGVSQERIQELTFTFRQFGLQQDDVADALGTVADRAQDAVQGTVSMQEDFALLGITVDELRGKRPAELFDLMARRVGEVEDPSRRTAAVVRTFGDELGRKLLPLLVQGQDALDGYAKSAREAGAVLDKDLNANQAEALRNFRKLREELDADFQRTIAANAEELGNLAENMAWFAEKTIEAAAGLSTLFNESRAERMDKLVARRDSILASRNQPLPGVGPDRRSARRQALDQELQRVNQQITDLQRRMEGAGPDGGISGNEPVQVPTIEISGGRRAKTLFDQLNPTSSPGIIPPSAAEQRAVGAKLRADEMFARGGGPGALESAGFDLPEVTRSMDELRDAAEGVNREGSRLNETMRGFGEITSSALEDAIINFESLGDVARSALEDIQRVILRTQVTGPIGNAIAGSFGGGGSGGVAGNVPMSADGNVFTGPSLTSIAERGEPEAVLPLARIGGQLGVQTGGGGGDVTVNVINQSGEQLEAQGQRTRRGPNGTTTVDVMVKGSIKRLDAQGQLDDVFRRHGAQRQGVR